MNKALIIAWNDLRLFLKAKAALVWIVIVPIIFIGFMGNAFRKPEDPANARPPVVIENNDTNFLSAIFMNELGSQGLRILSPGDKQTAPRRIVVPSDFTESVTSRKQVKVQYLKAGNTPSAEDMIVELRLIRALIAINSHLLSAASTNEGELAESAIRASQETAPLVRLESKFAGRRPTPVGFAFSLPGNIVMYTMLNLMIFGGASVARERTSGVIRRLAMHSATKGEAVTGKILGLVLLGLVQAIALLLAGRFLFGVQLHAPFSILIVLAVYSWVAGSLGLLAGSILLAEDKVTGVCLLIALGMAALGGCWWSLEIGPPVLRTIAHCIPSGWAMDALHRLISFGGSLPEVLKELGVLCLFGLGANLLARRFFRWS